MAFRSPSPYGKRNSRIEYRIPRALKDKIVSRYNKNKFKSFGEFNEFLCELFATGRLDEFF